jgi:cell division protein FtsW
MKLRDLLQSSGRIGPQGVAVRVKTHNLPGVHDPDATRLMPAGLRWGVMLAAAFYLLAHFSIVQGVWPMHGVAPRSGGVLIRDLFALLGWLLLLVAMHLLRYRGSWALVALPVMIFLFTRPALFQLFTDPVYQASSGTRAEANALKADRAQLTTILRAYDEERQQLVFQGPPPPIPDPIEAIRTATAAERRSGARLASSLSVVFAPVALLLAFLWARRHGTLRWVRDRRVWPFAVTFGIFLLLTLLPGVRATGKVAGTTPWELLLPIFVMVWAAVLADDAYNLARPGEVVTPRRVIGLLLYGALPVVPFLLIHELGLSIVLAGSLATMLLVGTRRGWWAGLMLAVWIGLVFAAFNLDERSQTRLALALDPYRDLSAMTAEEAEAWAARNHQIKLFDANILAGGWFGAGPGRGHAETAPNAADDGYVTTVGAQWGWFGTMTYVLLYTAFLIQMLWVAMRERSAFERSLATGMAMLIGIPFWLATLAGVRLIPLTGVATAFAAHGGAKLLASAAAVGIIAGISHRRAEAERVDEAVATPVPDLSDSGVRIR